MTLLPTTSSRSASPCTLPRRQPLLPAGYTGQGSDNLAVGGFGGFVFLLPYLEQDNLYRRWDLNAKWYDPPNSTLVRPR